jgi:hypothetical protein
MFKLYFVKKLNTLSLTWPFANTFLALVEMKGFGLKTCFPL